MRRLWLMAWQSVKLTFRDRGAVLLMLGLPFVLTLITVAAFGDGSNVLSDVPVLVLNRDRGTFGATVVEHLEAQSPLLAVERVDDEDAARARVESGEVAALVIIPADFSDRLFPLAAQAKEMLGIDLLTTSPEAMESLSQQEQMALGQLYLRLQHSSPPPTKVIVYGGPKWPVSVAVIEGVVQASLEQMQMMVQGISAVLAEMIQSQVAAGGEPDPSAFASMEEFAPEEITLPVGVETVVPEGRAFNWMDYMASGMALFMLMFTVTEGGRALLEERERGTLPRLLVMPLTPPVILVGKMAGVALTGLAQMLILWGATRFLGAWWGPPGEVLLIIVGLVLCATGMGALIAAWARNARQAGAIGTTVALIAAALSGNFLPRANLPLWMQRLSLITPNAWGLELFSRIQHGAQMVELLPWLAGMMAVTAGYYLVAFLGFRRQFA